MLELEAGTIGALEARLVLPRPELLPGSEDESPQLDELPDPPRSRSGLQFDSCDACWAGSVPAHRTRIAAANKNPPAPLIPSPA